MSLDHRYATAFTLFVAFCGVGIFYLAHAPLPWLLGSISALAVASRFPKLPLAQPKALSSPARAVLGLAVGSAFGPHALDGAGAFLGSLALIFPFVILTTVAGLWYYKHLLGYTTRTAYFSAIPGGLLEMVSLAEHFKADLHKVVLNQSARLLFIIFTIPFLIEHWIHVSLGQKERVVQNLAQTPWMELVAMGLCALVGWRLAVRLKIPGATIIGPMLLGMVVYSFDLIHTRPPIEIINLIQLILGATVGFVFVGISLQEILKTALQTLGYFLILALISAFFIFIAWWMTGFSLLSILLAFSPGGQAEVNVIAIVVGADLPYVALHHIVRLFLVMAIAPLMLQWFTQKKAP